MFVPVCNRLSVAKPKGLRERTVMETRSAAIHRKMTASTRQLPIIESAHKTGIVSLPHQATVDAAFRVTTQGRGPARLHCSHDPALNASEMALVLMAIISPVTVEYIRHFQIRAHGARLSRGA